MMIRGEELEKAWETFQDSPQDSHQFGVLKESLLAVGDWKKLAELYSLHVVHIEKSDQTLAAKLYGEKANIQEKYLSQAESAFEAYQKSYELQKQDNLYISSFILSCKNLKKWQILCQIWGEQLQQSNSKKEKLNLLEQLASCYVNEIKDRDKAKEILKDIIHSFDDNENAFQKLELLYLEDENYPELLQMYEQQIKTETNTTLKIKRLQQVATICEQLKKQEKAIDFYQQILELQPNDNYALGTLENLYRERKNWVAVLDIMKTKASLLNEEKRYEYYVSMAEIAEKELDDLEASSTYLEMSLPANDINTLSQLEQNYISLEKWLQLGIIYEKQIELVAQKKKRREIYFTWSELCEEKLNDNNKATACLFKALDEFPKDPEILQKLKDVQGSDLLSIYRMEVQWQQDIQKKCDLWFKMGKILQEQEAWENAKEMYENIVAEDPKNIEAYIELESMCVQLNDQEKLLQVLVKKSEFLIGETRVDTYNEIAELCKRLRKEDEAIIYYQKIRQLQPSNIKILYLLSDYYREKQDYQQLIQSLQQIINIDNSMYEHGYMEMAQIYELHLNNIDAACKSYEKIIQKFPENLVAYRKLRNLYKNNNKNSEYLKTTQDLASMTVEMSEKLKLLFSMCSFYQERDLVSKMENQLIDILEIDSYNIEAIDLLKNLYEKKQDWKKLVALLEKQIQVLDTIDIVIDQYQLIATYYHEKIKDIDQAVYYLEKVKALQPGNRSVLQKLEVLYTQQENFEKLVLIMQQNSYLATEFAQKSNYMYMSAMLLEEKLQKQSEAIIVYENVISHDPSHQNALERLKKIYKVTGDTKKLEEIYKKLSCVITDKNKLVELYLDVTQICDDKEYYYEKIVEINPKNTDAIEELILIYQKQENWEKLITSYVQKLNASTDRAKTKECHLCLAKIYEDKLNNPERAISHYEKVLHFDPKNIDIIVSLEKIYTECKDWKKLLPILQSKLRLSSSDERKSLSIQIAEIFKNKTLQFGEAVKMYVEILSLDESDVVTLKILQNLYKSLEDYPKALQIIDKELKLDLEQEKRIALLLEKAEIAQYHINQLNMATNSLEEILLLDPMHLLAFEHLKSLYHSREEYDKLLKLLENRCFVDKEKKLALQLEQAYICEKIKKWDKAILAYKNIFNQNKDSVEARKALLSILRTQKKWEELITFNEEMLQKTADSRVMIDIYNDLGSIWGEQLNKADEALEMYLQVLELDSLNIRSLRNIQNIYAKQQNFSSVLEMYLQELQIKDLESERKIWLYLMCGDIYENCLKNWPKAQENYIKVLYNDLDPNNLVAIHGLERVYRNQEKYNELQVMLLREFEIQKEPERSLQLHLEIAKLKEDFLDDDNGSIEFYNVVHKAWPKDIFIINSLEKLLLKQEMWIEYAKILEKKIVLTKSRKHILSLREKAMKIYGSKTGESDKAIEHANHILKIDSSHLVTIQYLQKIYRKLEKSELFAHMCMQEGNLIYENGDDKRISNLYMQAGKTYLSLHDNEKATFCFNQVLGINPSYAKALMNLIKIYGQTENWESLIDVYEWTAKASDNKDEVVNLHLKIARVCEDKIDNNMRALAHYQFVYSQNPENIMVIKALRSIYEKMQKWPEAVSILAEEALLEEKEKQAKIYFRMGEIWEKKLNSPIQARDNYLKVIEYGFHRRTIETLVEIQEKIGDYEGMVKILEEDIRKCDGEERLDKLLKLGKVYWYNLHKADDAIRTYTKILKMDSQHIETLAVMEEISRDKKDWKMLIGILNRETRNTEDPEKLHLLCVKMADIFYNYLGEGNRAIDFYEKALTYKECMNTTEKLQEAYEEWGYYNKLIHSINNSIEDIDPQKKTTLYRKLGYIYSERVFDDAAAIEIYEKILNIEDDIDACYSLVDIYKRQYLWLKLLNIYEKLIANAKLTMDVDEQLKLQLDVAKTHYHYIKNNDKAYEMFKECLDLSPANEEIYSFLEEILEEKQEYTELANLFTNKINISDTDEKKVNALHKLAKLSLSHLDHVDNGIHCYERILEISPKDIDAIESVEPLYLEKKNNDALINIHGLKLNAVTDELEQAKIYYKLAQVYSSMGDTIEVISHLKMSLAKYPNYIESIKMLANVLVGEKDWEQALSYIESALENTKNPDEKFTLYMTLGNITKNSIGDPNKAKIYFLQALDIKPQDVEALGEIIAIYVENERWTEAEILLERLTGSLPLEDVEKLVESYYEWGVTAQKQKKFDQAIARFKSALSKNEDHLPSILNLAKVFFSKQSFLESLEYYSKAYELESQETNINIVHQLAIIHKFLNNSMESIRFYKMLLERNFSRIETLKSLSNLHLQEKQWEEAMLYQQQVLQEVSSEEETATAYKQMGDIYQKLENVEKSIDFYLQAITSGCEETIVKENLVAMYIKQKDWEHAKDYNEKSYLQLDEDQKEENRNIHARILIGLNQNRDAILCYQEALKINSSSIKAIKGIASIYLAENNWSALSNAYREFLENLPEKKKANGLPIHLSLGYLYLEKIQNNSLAIEQFDKVLAITPEHTEALIAITKIKTQDPQNKEEAIKGHFRILKKDPLRLESYFNLHELLAQVGKESRAVKCYKAYRFLSGEKNEISSKIKNLSASAISSYIIPKPIQEICEIISLVDEHSEKIYPSNIEEDYGIKKREHLAVEQVQRPVWYHTHSIMNAMGIKDLHMYVTNKYKNEIFLENTTPPSLIMSQNLIDELDETSLRFLIAKYLFYVSQKQILVQKLEIHQLNEYWKNIYSCFGRSLFDSAEFEIDQKKWRSNIPRKTRKILESKEESWLKFSNCNVEQYIKYMDYASNRCAFTIIDSIDVAINSVYFWETGKVFSNILDQIKDIDTIHDLLLYNISESYEQLQKLL